MVEKNQRILQNAQIKKYHIFELTKNKLIRFQLFWAYLICLFQLILLWTKRIFYNSWRVQSLQFDFFLSWHKLKLYEFTFLKLKNLILFDFDILQDSYVPSMVLLVSWNCLSKKIKNTKKRLFWPILRAKTCFSKKTKLKISAPNSFFQNELEDWIWRKASFVWGW